MWLIRDLWQKCRLFRLFSLKGYLGEAKGFAHIQKIMNFCPVNLRII
ncbi:hypothetical protein OMCYN_01856 [cyanobiont of Ornithocercus magnificus]|nr:hypothetical protein OMCYN_01856 [cyanobiont of Ornithocercus magnificus]